MTCPSCGNEVMEGILATQFGLPERLLPEIRIHLRNKLLYSSSLAFSSAASC